MNYGIVCPHCGNQTDVDPAFLSDESPMPYCKECGQPLLDEDTGEYDTEDNWQHCDNCDLPDACADFGCAIKQGIKKDFPPY